MDTIQVNRVNSPEDYADSLKIRRQVFIQEQGVPETIEVDAYESTSEHFICRLGSEAVGTGRLRLKGCYAKFERIATLKSARGHGVGRALMTFIQAHANFAHPQHLQAMHAQETAVKFYLGLGWTAVGGRFLEADIPHQVLILPPKDRSQIERLLVWQDAEARSDIREVLQKLL